MKNRLAAVGVVAGLLGGAAVGVAFGVPAISSADSTPASSVPAAAAGGGTANSTGHGSVSATGAEQRRAYAAVGAEQRPAYAEADAGNAGSSSADLGSGINEAG